MFDWFSYLRPKLNSSDGLTFQSSDANKPASICDTAETGSTVYDTLKVQLRNSSGTVLTTLATYSNVNAASGYTQKSFNVLTYKGQTVQVYLVGTEDSLYQTSFVVDDFALNVQ